jgi:tetratricopeptide (TPR) repeat protein
MEPDVLSGAKGNWRSSRHRADGQSVGGGAGADPRKRAGRDQIGALRVRRTDRESLVDGERACRVRVGMRADWGIRQPGDETMVPRLIAAACVLTHVFGCSLRVGSRGFHEDLSWARSSLSLGSPREAERYLNQVEAKGLSRAGKVQAKILRAEIELRKGSPETAIALADEAGAHDRFSAQAHEVAGKALIQLSRFEEAIARFDEALVLYSERVDIERVVDLVSVAEGFGAYADGDPVAANEHWGRIHDSNLAASIEAALRRARDHTSTAMDVSRRAP